MVDESLYLTTNEAALAVVATGMKKSRLRLDTLIVNSFMGGVLFTTGGMLHEVVQARCREMYKDNPGLIQLIQGLVYPIGLFYVVIMGVDLFNSNILFFSVALARNAVSILDLFISWFVSWWFNLIGTIFVCYIICDYSHVTRSDAFILGSIEILMQKAEYSFTQTLLKGMAGNFFVCLAIYLQLMAKPLHVKFLLMLLPVFTFVTMGFTHSVADMFMLIIGLINGAPISVGKVAWKIFLPGALGNMIGGSFFGLVVPWYLHIYVVERDLKLLKLPKYDVRDEQPELNQDSRVVRQRAPSVVDEYEEDIPLQDEKLNADNGADISSSSSELHNSLPPQAIYEPSFHNLSKVSSRATAASRFSTKSRRWKERSPPNVFPVYGMGPPLERERSIASGRDLGYSDDNDRNSTQTMDDDTPGASAEFIGNQLKRALTRRGTSTTKSDLESQKITPTLTRPRPSVAPTRLKRFSLSSTKNQSYKNNLGDLNAKMDKAGIPKRSAEAANEAAGISQYSMTQQRTPTRINNLVPVDPIEEFSTSADQTPIDGASFNVAPYEPSIRLNDSNE